MSGAGVGVGAAAAPADGRRHRPLFTAGNRLPGYPAVRRTSSGGEGEEGSVERRLRPTGHMFRDGVVVYKERTSSSSRERSSRCSSAGTSRDSSPRPARAEEIPLEHIRRAAAQQAVSVGTKQDEAASSQAAKEPITSEETSFISEGQSRRRGLIQTI